MQLVNSLTGLPLAMRLGTVGYITAEARNGPGSGLMIRGVLDLAGVATSEIMMTGGSPNWFSYRRQRSTSSSFRNVLAQAMGFLGLVFFI